MSAVDDALDVGITLLVIFILCIVAAMVMVGWTW